MIKLHHDDCLTVLASLDENSIDALITDPPAGIAFMGKAFDTFKSRDHFIETMVPIYRECLRVMKPGAHGLVWGIPKTAHHTATALENAGFEVRDCIASINGQGFPKSTNLLKQLQKDDKICICLDYEKIKTKANLSSVSHDLSTKEQDCFKQSEILQQQMPRDCKEHESRIQCASKKDSSLGQEGMDAEVERFIQDSNVGGKQSCLERGEIHRAWERLCDDKDTRSSESTLEWIRPGTHSSDGKEIEKISERGGSSSSQESQSIGQSDSEFEAICEPQGTLGSTPQRGLYCSECGKVKREKIEGLGTGLKPAVEFWYLIRKPLSEKTVAKNVLKWGCGALNIDASRIACEPFKTISGGKQMGSADFFIKSKNPNAEDRHVEWQNTTGRFPANLVFSHNHDCEDACTEGCAVAMLDDQAGVLTSGSGQKSKNRNSPCHDGGFKPDDKVFTSSSGSASRFFYCSKASRSDRGQSNGHPTVKSTKLMSYLINLITPPHGVILDCFMGSGSTGVAAKRLGFGFVGIEKEAEYFEIAKRRIEHG